MNFDLSKLSSMKVESLVQQGLDTILNRQTKAEASSVDKVSLIKKSLDQKGNYTDCLPAMNLPLPLSKYAIKLPLVLFLLP
ncbi:hypothetical protein NON20_09840 [Synechocystis sp. B12]|nr:hypothetical protein NON20_09840 [Synechocystis sp. B12]